MRIFLDLNLKMAVVNLNETFFLSDLNLYIDLTSDFACIDFRVTAKLDYFFVLMGCLGEFCLH